MILKKALALPFTFVFAVSALAQSDGFDFKGVPLGSSVEAVQSKYPEFYCEKTPRNPLGDAACHLEEEQKCFLEQGPYPDNRSCRDAVKKARTYAGVAAAHIDLRFYEDKLSMASVTFAPDRFSDVVAAVREKYGEPHSTNTESVSNRAGATFENHIYEWKKAGTTIRAEKYSSRLDRAAIKIFSDSFFTEFEKRKGTKAKEGAKDL
jgi:hypothetical protein